MRMSWNWVEKNGESKEKDEKQEGLHHVLQKKPLRKSHCSGSNRTLRHCISRPLTRFFTYKFVLLDPFLNILLHAQKNIQEQDLEVTRKHKDLARPVIEHIIYRNKQRKVTWGSDERVLKKRVWMKEKKTRELGSELYKAKK